MTDPRDDPAPRLKTSIRVQAILRRYDVAAIPAVVRRKGDPDAGAVMIKVALGEAGALILSQSYGRDGAPAWLRHNQGAPLTDADAEAAIVRAIGRDPDLYVLEIEDPSGALMLDAPVL